MSNSLRQQLQNLHIKYKLPNVTINTYMDDQTVDAILNVFEEALPPARTGKSIEADYKERVKSLLEEAKKHD